MKIINVVFTLFTIGLASAIFLAIVSPMNSDPNVTGRTGLEITSFVLVFVISYGLIPILMFSKYDSILAKHEEKIRKSEKEKTMEGFLDSLYNSKREDPEFYQNVMCKDAPVGRGEKGISTVYNRIVDKADEYLNKA